MSRNGHDEPRHTGLKIGSGFFLQQKRSYKECLAPTHTHTHTPVTCHANPRRRKITSAFLHLAYMSVVTNGWILECPFRWVSCTAFYNWMAHLWSLDMAMLATLHYSVGGAPRPTGLAWMADKSGTVFCPALWPRRGVPWCEHRWSSRCQHLSRSKILPARKCAQ